MVTPRSANAPHRSASRSVNAPPSLVARKGKPDLPDPLVPLRWGAHTLAERGRVYPFRLNGLVPAPYNAIGTRRGTGWSGNAISAAFQSPMTGLPCSGSAYCHDSERVQDSNPSPCDRASSASAKPADQARDLLSIPHPGWFGANAPVSLDPFGLEPVGHGLQSTITLSTPELRWAELDSALEHGWLEADGTLLKATGQLSVVRLAIAPVWYLPGIAERLQLEAAQLRQALYEKTDGLFPELITRPDLEVFLPPLAETVVDILGPVNAIRQGHVPLVLHIDRYGDRTAAETNTSASRIQALETCIETAQAGGVSVMIGLPPCRATGSDLGTSASPHTWELKLVPDVLHWLGIQRIDQFLSTSYDCSDELARSGLEVVQQVALSDGIETTGLAIECGYLLEEPSR